MKTQKERKRTAKISTHRFWLIGVMVGGLAFSVMVYARASVSGKAAAPKRPQSSGSAAAFSFTDARQQAAAFISYDHSITLTSEQQKVMDTALSSIPAPCCDRYSIATCCCPCNLARSTWGLAKLLITRDQASAAQVKSAALDWLQFINPDGYTGDACFTKGCERPFERNGCGGMRENHIT